MPVETILLSVLPPIGIALVIMVGAWRPWSKTPPPVVVGVAASALALALGYAVTESLVLHAWPGFPPREAHRWLPYAGLAAAIGIIAVKGKDDGRLGVSSFIALASFAALRWAELSSKQSVLYGAMWVLLGTVVAGSMRTDALAGGKRGVLVPLCWLVATVGLSLAAFKDSFQTAFLTGSIGAVLGVVLLLAIWRPAFELVTGLAPVMGVLYVGTVLTTASTVECKVLVMLAALAPGLAGVPAVARMKPKTRVGLCLLLTLGLSVAAVWQSPGGFDFSGY
jgi:hypothetical protein